MNAIQALIAPAVMISACGLLCMALYNRLAALTSEAHALHRERIDRFLSDAPGERERAVRSLRFEGLERQTHALLNRATLVRNSVLFLIGCIVCMLLSSLLIGVSMLTTELERASEYVFVVGVLSMLLGMSFAGAEVWRCLDQLRFEHAQVESLHDGDGS